ncbi:flippase [Candidatus Woesearchaeota archaeon]|nr:flippase [Candidatus Woesearchaeota archaeon]
MSYTKLAVKGAATVFIISILAAFLGYVARFILARNLTLEEFGLFYSVFAFLGMFGVFKSLGFDRALAKFIPEFVHKKNYDQIKSSIIYVSAIQLLTNTIVIIGIYLFSAYLSQNFFRSPQAGIVLKLMAIAFFLDSFALVLKFAFQGFKKMAYFAGIDAVKMLLVIAITLVGVGMNYGILGPVIAYVISTIIIILVFGFILIKKIFPSFLKSKFVYEGKLMKEISRYSIFAMSGGVGMVILGYTDTILLTYFSGLTSVALYNVALPTAKVLMYFPRSITGILLPLISELWAKKEKALIREGIESLYKYTIIIIIPLVFMILSFSDLIINILFGEEYVLASNALKVLSIGMIFAVLYAVNIDFFLGIGKPEVNSLIVYSAALFNLVANFIMIPVWGIMGAAISTTVSYFIMMAIGVAKIRKYIKIKFPVKIWVKTSIAGVIFVFVILFLKWVLALNAWIEAVLVLAIAGLAYLALLFLLKVVDIDELKIIYNRISR